MKKKLAGLLLAAAMLGGAALSASSQAPAQLTLGPLSASGGDAALPLSLSGSEAGALELTVQFDAEVLRYREFDPAELPMGTVYSAVENEPGRVTLVFASVSALDGALGDLRFTSGGGTGDAAIHATAEGYSAASDAPVPISVTLETAAAPTPAPTSTPTPKPEPTRSGGGGGGSGSSGGTAAPEPTPTPAPSALPAPAFTDTAGHWGAEYVTRAALMGLFNGYGDGRFGPDDPVTRAQFMTVVWRMAGRPAAGNPPFTDTAGESAEFRSAIAWGAAKGYINGVAPGSFAPSASLTREQAMKILYFYAGGDQETDTAMNEVYARGFLDADAISAWAREPMFWGVRRGLISGGGDGTLNPGGTATRAQLAKILVTYLERLGGEGGV